MTWSSDVLKYNHKENSLSRVGPMQLKAVNHNDKMSDTSKCFVIFLQKLFSSEYTSVIFSGDPEGKQDCLTHL